MVSTYLGLLAGGVMLAACIYSAYVLAMRICPRDRVSVRCCCTLLVAGWLQVAVFELLATLHGFRLAVALPVCLAVAVVFHKVSGSPSRSALAQACDDWRQIRRVARSVCSSSARSVVVLTAAVSAVHLLRGLTAPPLAWDALTYQLFRPALWVQTAALAVDPAPDAWSYYAHFPYAGNVLWAWAMLPVRGDLLLAPAGFAVWAAVLLAGYAIARQLGTGPITAVLAAVSIGLTPAVFAYVISGYVDNTLLAAFLLGTLFLVRACAGRRREAFLAAAGFGLAAGVKLTGAVLLCLAGLALLVCLVRLYSGVLQRLGAAAVMCAAAAPGVIPYLRTWVEKGSPLYPKALRVLGSEWLAGNEQFTLATSGAIFPSPPPVSQLDLLWSLFVPRPPLAGLGIVAPILIALGAVGLAGLMRRRILRAPAAAMLIFSIATVGLLCTPDAYGIRTYWSPHCGRFLTPALSCFVLWAATVRHAPRWIWFGAAGFGLIMALPQGWSPADVKAAGSGLVWLGVGFAGAWGCWRLARRLGRRGLGAALVLLVANASLLPLIRVRQQHRYAMYEAAGEHRSWMVHRLNASYASSWPIWRYLDTALGRRIAVTAGWEPPGHNWYRYPLLGSRLQNELVYVPITRDATIVDYRDGQRINRCADYGAWLQRLVEKQIEYVVTLAPDNTREARWADRHPELFEKVAESLDQESRAYRFNCPLARRRLDEP